MTGRVVHYFDYKSPYAYLAQEATLALAAAPGVALEWRPYTLNIPEYLGSAELDGGGSVVAQSRNAHQWRRVRYSYADCRREATRRGLTIRGPRKIYDSSIAHIGFYYACEHGDFRGYHGAVFEQFWKRELDIEDPGAIARVLEHGGIDPSGFDAFLAGPGRERHDANQADAESHGVFGVPSYCIDDDLYWGLERLCRVAERLGVPVPAAAM